jgi:two-component system CheB/CheR fusion protein
MKKSPARPSKKQNHSAAPSALKRPPAVTPSKPTSSSFPIVGVGASAGALEAYTQLLKSLPAEPGMALVLVPHLDPTHASALSELLSHVTRMPVLEAQDGMEIRADHVYVLPPNFEMRVSKRALHLKPREPGRTPHMVIDIFLRSLADDQGSNAIGVILSGTASDGTLGVTAVKGEGGITFAQDSKSARYDGMPSSAVASGCIDFILPPERIAEELVRLRRHPYVAKSAESAEEEIEKLGEEPRNQLARVFRLLREVSNVDFSEYKPGTIQRRILRRMALRQFDRLGAYVRYLQQHRGEIYALYQDLLINVTSFFRNPEAFAALKDVVYPALLKERLPGDTIRIWVPGCSSGEEAYSHAMSLIEYMGEVRAEFPIQIFGTDLSEAAIQKARTGIYKESIRSDVSQARLRRFFTSVEGGYQISKAIRDVCVFAVQNVFKDPPFSRMDIVSCRNVLIYMGPALQKRIIPILHYSLKPKGFLMVGNTEGLLGGGANLFEIVDKKHKLYSKRLVPSPVQFGFMVDYQPRARKAEAAVAPPKEMESIRGPLELQREADRLLLARYVPAAVVVNDQLEILQTRGHTHHYLELPPGRASLNLLKMVRPGLLFELQNALQQVRRKGVPVRKENLHFGDSDLVSIEVTPFKAPLNQGHNFLIIFEEAPAHAEASRKAARRKPAAEAVARQGEKIERLKQELAATKEYLQSIIEAQEASNEELQSANEEIQSGNEELQSTNEELQTSKEELESANEELNTVNEEMQHRNTQLTQVNNDLTNFLNSVNIPMVMLGPDLAVRRFTPQCDTVLGLAANDVGRPITNLRLKIEIPDLETQLLNVIQDVKSTQQEIQDPKGSWWRLRFSPYRTWDNKIDGAVVTLQDINALKQANAELEIERAKLEEIFLQMPFGLLIAEVPSGKLLRTNDRLKDMLGYPFTDDVKISDYARYALRANGEPYKPEEWPITRSMKGEVVKDEEMEWRRADGHRVFLSVNSAPIQPEAGKVVGVMAAFFDLTYRRSGEEMLRVSEQMAATGRLAAALAHEINNPLEILTNAVYLLGEDKTLGEGSRKYTQMADAELRRIAHISQNLLGLYRGGPASEEFRVQDVLNEVLGFLEGKIAAKNIRLAKRYDYHDEMHGSPTEVRQILLNLIGNAVEAMGQNGVLSLRVSPSRDWKNMSASGIRICVADNGQGIGRENRSRVFEPFFTTKGEKGTGLGLWVSRGIVNKYGGSIRFRSRTGPEKSGTCFSVFLPSRLVRRRSRAQAAEVVAAVGSDGQGGGEAEG